MLLSVCVNVKISNFEVSVKAKHEPFLLAALASSSLFLRVIRLLDHFFLKKKRVTVNSFRRFWHSLHSTHRVQQAKAADDKC